MEVSVLGFPMKDLPDDPCWNKERKVASTKQFIKDSTLSRWESRQVPRSRMAPSLFWDWVFVASLWAERSCDIHWGGL